VRRAACFLMIILQRPLSRLLSAFRPCIAVDSRAIALVLSSDEERRAALLL
jgi:hypothetical protein